jgi:hypothetical protein
MRLRASTPSSQGDGTSTQSPNDLGNLGGNVSLGSDSEITVVTADVGRRITPTRPLGKVVGQRYPTSDNSYTPAQYFGGGKRRRQRPAALPRGRGGPAGRGGHTACHPRFTEVQSRSRPSPCGAEGAAGGSRRAQEQRDVNSRDWKGVVTRTSTGLTRLRTRCPSSPPAPSHSLASPRASSTRPAPSKPRAPPSRTAEVATRVQRRDRRG